METYKDRSGITQSQFTFEECSVDRPQVESLEGRTMFSGGPIEAVGSNVVLQEAVERFTHVYDMPLHVSPAVAPAAAPAIGQSPVRAANGPQVILLPSDDSSILTGIYSDAVALRTSVHPAEAGISAKGSQSLVRLDTQSYAGRPPSVRPMSAPPGARRRVLLIEDDKTSRIALMTLLKRRGFIVTAAATMQEGLSQLKEHPDNVIVDLMLPDGEGESVVRQIRDSHLAARVTVMTGVSDPARLANLNRLKPESILSKPINVAALLREMAKVN